MAVVNTFKKKALDAVLALGTPKAMLLTSSHTTNIDTQEYIDDVSANELSSSGYTTGGETLASVTSVINNTTDVVALDAADIVLTGLTGTVRYVVFYVDTATASTSPIINIVDLGSDQVLSSQDLTLTINSTGILTM